MAQLMMNEYFKYYKLLSFAFKVWSFNVKHGGFFLKVALLFQDHHLFVRFVMLVLFRQAVQQQQMRYEDYY
jgi:hypothetical protein